jgi:hypothetical protein
VTGPEPRYGHLLELTDDVGLFQHALFTAPRKEHGYRVDDVARGLVVLCRADDDAPRTVLAARTYLDFLTAAQAPDGRIVNRCDVDGRCVGPAESGDCWGRALWGLGTAVGRSQDHELVERAMSAFEVSVCVRSPSLRSMAYAGLGAAEFLRARSPHSAARALLRDAAVAVARTGRTAPDASPEWPWPQARLTYANALLPDVLLAAGDCLGDHALVEHGLALLGWLLDLETAGDHLSPTSTSGWAPGEPRPGFDQQPIEVSTMADACARAYELTGDRRWAQAVELAAAWFFGANDTGAVLGDSVTGGSCDGLQRSGRNENQGAESTLALLSTLQHAERLRRIG